MNNFINKHFVNYSDIKSNSDQIPIFYAYLFDLYFDFSLKVLRDKKYLDKFTDRIYENFKNTIVQQQVKRILEVSNNFLDN